MPLKARKAHYLLRFSLISPLLSVGNRAQIVIWFAQSFASFHPKMRLLHQKWDFSADTLPVLFVIL
jgi:hypothetical protein